MILISVLSDPITVAIVFLIITAKTDEKVAFFWSLLYRPESRFLGHFVRIYRVFLLAHEETFFDSRTLSHTLSLALYHSPSLSCLTPLT